MGTTSRETHHQAEGARAQAPESMPEPSSLERLPLAGLRLDAIERAAIRATLEQASGNKVRAARLLGIAVSTLYEKLKKYAI